MGWKQGRGQSPWGCALAAQVNDRFGVSLVETTVGRALRAMDEPEAFGASPPSRPGPGSPGGIEKNFPDRTAEIRDRPPPDTAMEMWFEDEAGIGRKNKITRRWAKPGTRPSAPRDQRPCSAYILGAICPARGVGAALVPPRCNPDAMNLHLKEISLAVAAHAVLIADQAG